MIPKRIRPFFKTISTSTKRATTLIEGNLTCCNSAEFEICVVGRIRHTIFSRMSLYHDTNRIVLYARCKQCGQIILVFDSDTDGYDACNQPQNKISSLTPIACSKCLDNNYSVNIKYEYPDDLDETNIDNLFTWIWITLICNDCGAKYNNFISFETA